MTSLTPQSSSPASAANQDSDDAESDAQRQRLAREIESLQAKLVEAERGRKRLADELRVIKTSRSWRLTAPLRALGSRFQRRTGEMAKTAPRAPARRIVALQQVAWDATAPLISILVAHDDGEAIAAATTESIRQQSLQSVEIVPAGVTGESACLTAAWRAALGMARGKYICCLLSGDTLTPTYLEKCAIALEISPSVGFVYPAPRSASRDQSDDMSAAFDLRTLMQRDIVPHCAVFRRTAWDIVGGMRSGVADSVALWDFWLSLAEQGWRGSYIPEHLARLHNNPTTPSHAHEHIARAHPRLFGTPGIERSIIDGYYDARMARPLLNLSHPSLYAQSGPKQRVLFLVNWLAAGGGETWLYDVLHGLAQTGDYALYVATTRQGDNAWLERFMAVTPFIYHLPDLAPDPVWLDIVVNMLRSRSIDTLTLSLAGWGYENMAQIRQWASALRILNVLHSDFDPGFLQASVANDQYVDQHVVVNQRIKERLAAVYGVAGDRIAVVPNGVDTDRMFNPAHYTRAEERTRWGISATVLVVTWIGRINREKQPEQFVALAAALRQRSNVVFVMAGDGIQAAAIRQLAAEERLGKRFRMAGVISPERVAGLLACSDVLVLTSTFEGGPRNVLEALAMNTPVVSYAVGHVPDVVRDGVNGFVVEQGRFDMLQQRVADLLDDGALLAACKARARASVIDGGFTTQRMNEQWRMLLSGAACSRSKEDVQCS